MPARSAARWDIHADTARWQVDQAMATDANQESGVGRCSAGPWCRSPPDWDVATGLLGIRLPRTHTVHIRTPTSTPTSICIHARTTANTNTNATTTTTTTTTRSHTHPPAHTSTVHVAVASASSLYQLPVYADSSSSRVDIRNCLLEIFEWYEDEDDDDDNDIPPGLNSKRKQKKKINMMKKKS